MRLRKTRAFMIETLILVFLLLVVLSVLTQVTGKAGALSQRAKRETAATMIAQNAAAEFQLGRGDIGEAERELILENGGSETAAAGVLAETGDKTTSGPGIGLLADEGAVRELPEESEAGDGIVRPGFTAEQNSSGNLATAFLEMRYREDGMISEDGDYRVSIQMGCEEKSAGSLLNAQIFVYYKTQEEVLASLDTARYIPDYESVVVTVDGEGEITEEMLADAAAGAGAEDTADAEDAETAGTEADDTEEELQMEMETEAGS